MRRLYDLEQLAHPPAPGEQGGCFSSYDRRSVYDQATRRYLDWGANEDGGGFIRREGDDIVAVELDGPGVIWRVWSALPGDGPMRVYVDGGERPVWEKPFRQWFERPDESISPAGFPSIAPKLSGGQNSYIPIPFQKQIKITFGTGWGAYYHFTYTRFPQGTQLPSFGGTFGREACLALAVADRLLYRRGFLRSASGEPVHHTLPAGQCGTVFAADGPGAIDGLCVTADLAALPAREQARLLRAVTLSITWDGGDTPAVWAPLGDFFGTAPGVNPYRALPQGTWGDALYSNWYMPFSRGAKIEMHNDGARDFSFSLRVSARPLPIEQADALLRFHARWHTGQWAQPDAARFAPGGDRWPDWPLLLAQGPGRYCGMHLHVYNSWPQPDLPASSWWYGHGDAKTVDWWWGEGDEKFFVDGEAFPSTFGTGSEDYIGYAWAAEPPFALFDSPFACQPHTPLDGNGHTSVSRFHVCDNIPFERSFDGFLEKYKGDVWGAEGLGRCLYAATPYWYQASAAAGPHMTAALPQRLKTLE